MYSRCLCLTNLVCVLFDPAIPTSFFNFIVFFYTCAIRNKLSYLATSQLLDLIGIHLPSPTKFLCTKETSIRDGYTVAEKVLFNMLGGSSQSAQTLPQKRLQTLQSLLLCRASIPISFGVSCFRYASILILYH